MKKRMFGHRLNKKSSDMHETDQIRNRGKAMDNPPNYEGKEHVRYADPGFSGHHIRFPQDEPHMKSHVTREEEHEAEDDFHMPIPNQTEENLEPHIKRARMKMDAPDQEDPDQLRGNIVHNVGYEGEEDTSGEEEMGPNEMQEDGMSKDRRKKMIIEVMKRKMKRHASSGHREKGEMDEEKKRKMGGNPY